MMQAGSTLGILSIPSCFGPKHFIKCVENVVNSLVISL